MKKVFIGIAVIIFYILSAVGLNKLEENKRTNNYPDETILMKDAMRYFNDSTLDGKNMKELVKKDKIEISDIKYTENGDYLDVDLNLHYSDEITINKALELTYYYDDEKWQYRNFHTDYRFSEYYITNCDPKIKVGDNIVVMDYLESYYDGTFSLIDTSKEGKKCKFNYNVNTEYSDYIVEVSLELNQYGEPGYGDTFEYDIRTKTKYY